MITTNNFVLEYGEVLCLHEQSLMMNVLNSVSICTKTWILRVLEKFPEKLLLMIDVVLSMGHSDIIFTVLCMIFNRMLYDHTYEVCTYVNRNGRIEPLLCYSKVCGFENDMYGMSKYLIKYFDETHDTYDYQRVYTSARNICGNDWLIDSEQRSYLLKLILLNKMIIIGKWGEFGISSVIYVIGSKPNASVFDTEYINSQFKLACVEGSKFYEFVKGELDVESVNIRLHHNIVDGKLC